MVIITFALYTMIYGIYIVLCLSPLPLPLSLSLPPPPSLPLPLSFPPSLPPLSPPSPVSIATVSEYQRFLSRLVAHKTLRIEQPFIVFLTGTIEVRKAKHCNYLTLYNYIELSDKVYQTSIKNYKLFCWAQSGRDSC